MRRYVQRVLTTWHGLAAVGWAIAGVYGWVAGWKESIAFLFVASVWANVAAELAGVSGERPDQQVLDRLDELEELIRGSSS